MSDNTFDCDRAATLLPAADYARVRSVAGTVVEMYGGDGPPFPILKLWDLLESLTIIERLDDGRERNLYGYTFPIEFARHRRYAALYLDTTAPTDEVFVTAFHETGHVLLHILQPNDPPQRVFDRQADGWHPVPRAQAEIEADLFARLTTMPATWMRDAWPYACTLGATPAAATIWMAYLFGVPRAWMAERLVSLRLLPAPPE